MKVGGLLKQRIMKDIIELVKASLTQRDKWMHFASGFAISMIVGLLFNWWAGFVLAFLAACLKEGYDGNGHGTPEIMDMVFTILGGAVAILITIWF